MKALAIAGVNLRRMFRDRVGLFFLFVLPFLLVLVLGAAFGGGVTPKLGVVGGDAHLLDALRADRALQVETSADDAALRTAVERGEVSAGLVVTPTEVRLLTRPDQGGQQMRLAVDDVLSRESARLAAARFTSTQTGVDQSAALAVVDSVVDAVPPVSVEVTTSGRSAFPESAGRFDTSASTQLLLFVFLTALTGSAALVETRRLGVSRRMLATPTTSTAIVLGEGLGRVAVALVQGVVIVAGTSLLFGVRWGDPIAAGVLLLVFALVAGGAGMVLGAVFRTEQQVGAAALMLGIGFAALGGSMVPLELFGDTVRTIALVTPHAWANNAFAELARHGGLVDVLPEIGVLAGYAVVLFAFGAWRLHRSLSR